MGNQQHVVSAESVRIGGFTCQGLWDVYVDGVRWRRYGFHQNSLVHVPTHSSNVAVAYWPCMGEVEAAIDRLYREQSDD